jgi:hypothetical protein
MRDIFSEGLLYLDLLEIYGSTYAVAEICGIAQSNVFRGANACAKLLNLGLTKDKQNGCYRVERNLDVQRDLRRLNQRMRAREHGFLRIVGADVLLANQDMTLEQAKTCRPLPVRWQDAGLSLDYLDRSLLDVVVVRASQVAKRTPWPPPVRRRDLFVPLDPFACTELYTLPLVLLAKSTHPLIKSDSLTEVCELEWIVDGALPLDQIRAAYPSVSLHSLQDQGCTEEMAWARVQADPGLLWLTDLSRYTALKRENSDCTLRPLNLDLGLQDYLLAITLMPLIREPMHQSLIHFLRELASPAYRSSPVPA